MHKYLVFGNGPHSRVVVNQMNQLDFFDIQVVTEVDESSILLEVLKDLPADTKVFFHIGIGDNTIRNSLVSTCLAKGFLPITIISQDATIEESSVIEEGAFIGPKAYVGINCYIGSHVILNTSACIDHDVRIGSFSHVAGNAYIAGGVNIGERVLIGAGATVIENCVIDSDITIGAGSVVTKNLETPGTYVGAPAKLIHP